MIFQDSGISIDELRVDGGAAANDLLMQFQSDILDRKVIRMKNLETTSLGAAYLAGLAIGFWKGRDEITGGELSKIYTPSMDDEKRERLLNGWKRAVGRSLAWEIPEE